MARRCQLLGKQTTSGNNRPFSLKATKRTFRPNLFKKRIFNPFTGKMERMTLSAKAIRTLKKWGREADALMPAEEVKEAPKTEKKTATKKATPAAKKAEAAAAKEVETKSQTEASAVKKTV